MEIKNLKLGPLQTNCYIINIKDKCLIIDPALEIDKIINVINNPIAILITHYHYDHIGALEELKEKYNLPIYDYNNIGKINIEPFSFEIIPFKGHHNTCVAFYFESKQVMFTGDFLFRNSIGRTDLEDSNELDMFESISKIKKYDDNIIIYPGHGEITNLGYEKENNYFLKLQ